MIGLDNITTQAEKYLGLKKEALKLKTVEGLSVGVSRFFTLMVMLLIAAISLAAIAFGLLILLGDLIGSWAASAFIIGGVFLIILVLLYVYRKKLFVDMFVQLFIGIFYEDE